MDEIDAAHVLRNKRCYDRHIVSAKCRESLQVHLYPPCTAGGVGAGDRQQVRDFRKGHCILSLKLALAANAQAIPSLAFEMEHNLARPRLAAMFEEKDALAAAEQQLAFENRNSKMGLRDRALDMGRHVVGTFRVMTVV